MTHDEAARALRVSDAEGRALRRVAAGKAFLRYGEARHRDADTAMINRLKSRKMLYIITDRGQDTSPIYTRAELTAVGRIALRRWELERAIARKERRAA